MQDMISINSESEETRQNIADIQKGMVQNKSFIDAYIDVVKA